jgi:hypothetical protein
MAYDNRYVKKLIVDGTNTVIGAHIRYESLYTVLDSDGNNKEEIRSSKVNIDENGLAASEILFQIHITDVQTDYPAIIGQPLGIVLATFGLTEINNIVETAE